MFLNRVFSNIGKLDIIFKSRGESSSDFYRGRDDFFFVYFFSGKKVLFVQAQNYFFAV